jgi:hypothetical protein
MKPVMLASVAGDRLWAALAGAVLVAASPGGPVQPVGLVSPRWRDAGVTQKPQQLRHGDRDQPGVQIGVGLLPALQQ